MNEGDVKQAAVEVDGVEDEHLERQVSLVGRVSLVKRSWFSVLALNGKQESRYASQAEGRHASKKSSKQSRQQISKQAGKHGAAYAMVFPIREGNGQERVDQAQNQDED